MSRIPFSMAGIPSIKEGVQIQTANTVSQNKTLNLPFTSCHLRTGNYCFRIEILPCNRNCVRNQILTNRKLVVMMSAVVTPQGWDQQIIPQAANKPS